MKTVAARHLMHNVAEGATEAGPNIQLEHVESRTGRLIGEIPQGPATGSNRFEAGDVLFSKLRPYLAKSHRVMTPTNGSGEFLCLRPTAEMPTDYLFYYTLGRPWLDHAVTTSYGTKMPRTSWDQMASHGLPELSHGERQRIADFLDDRVGRIDRIIAARRRQLQVLSDQFDNARRRAVLGPPTAVTDLPWARMVGQDHTVRRLQQMATMGTGHTPSRNVPEYWRDTHIPWLTTTDVHRFRRDEIDSLESTEIQISTLGLANSAAVLHPKGTVALSRTASAGFSVVMGSDMATSQDFVTWTCGPDLEPHYLLHALRVMRPYLLGFLATGSTHKTIYFPDLMDLRLPVPRRALQEQAVAEVARASSAYHGARAALTRSIDLLTEYKQSLITAAVTGQFDVTTASTRIPE